MGTSVAWRGREEAGITLSGLRAAGDGDDTLSATLSGIPAGWTVKDGAVVLSNGAGFAASDLGSLVVTAPDQGGESAFLTDRKSVVEGERVDPGGRRSIKKKRNAEVSVFCITRVWRDREEECNWRREVCASDDGDDTLSATLSGIPAGWTVKDGAVVLSNGAGFAASDLGLLVVTAPDQGGESAFLTLTVSTAEGGGTSAVEILSVTASGVAELPVFGATTVWHGSEDRKSVV